MQVILTFPNDSYFEIDLTDSIGVSTIRRRPTNERHHGVGNAPTNGSAFVTILRLNDLAGTKPINPI